LGRKARRHRALGRAASRKGKGRLVQGIAFDRLTNAKTIKGKAPNRVVVKRKKGTENPCYEACVA